MIKISACVIAKNEEKNIGRWLDNVRQIADEIIVVDTGSSDQTVSLAEQGGAKVFHFDWCNDFAAAKNFALDQAHGQWIIFLDADEYFSPVSVPQVRQVVEHYEPDRKVVGIICKLVNIDQDRDSRFSGAICQVRLFRNLQRVRYAGRVHEQLMNISGKGRILQFAQQLVIYHTGYSSSIIRRKLERNLAILQAEIKRRGPQEADAFYLMDCYNGLGEPEKAAECARQAIASGLRFVGMEGHAEVRLVEALLAMKKPAAEILPVLQQAIARYPQAVEFYLLQGVVFWQAKDYRRTEQILQQAIKYAQQEQSKPLLTADGEQALTLSDNAGALWPYAYLYLGQIAAMHFEVDQAFDYYWQGLTLSPYEPALFYQVCHSLSEQKPADIIQLFNGLYDKKADAAWLAAHLDPLQLGDVYLYYVHLAKTPQALRDYMAARRWDAAAVQAGNELESLYRLGIVTAVSLGLPQAKMPLQQLLPTSYREAWQQLAAGKKTAAAGERPSLGAVLTRMQRSLFPAPSVQAVVSQRHPQVSILIPTYNRPELFELTLRSALAQTYQDFEVVVTDNSTDDQTETLIQKYTGNPQLHYVRNRQAKTKAENFRPMEQLAKGEYLQWLMDDDILVKEKLARMVPVLQKQPQVMLVTSQRGVIDGTGKILPDTSALLPIQGACGIFGGREIGRAMLLSMLNFLGEPSAVLFRRRDLVHHYWAAESRGYQTISDVAMWLELLAKGDCAIFREPLSYYRRHAAQEGQQPDVILLSRVEWYQLMQESRGKDGFLSSKTDFQAAIERLYQEYQGSYPSFCQQRNAAESMRQRYQAVMEEIGQYLSGQGDKA